MRIKDFEILIASPPDRDFLVAEIYYKDLHWAEISQDNGLVIHFYKHPTQKWWEIPFDEAIHILEQAKKHLLGV